MNAAGTTHGARRPDWLSKVEQALNRAADAFLEGAESLAKELDELWTSVTRRFSRTYTSRRTRATTSPSRSRISVSNHPSTFAPPCARSRSASTRSRGTAMCAVSTPRPGLTNSISPRVSHTT